MNKKSISYLCSVMFLALVTAAGPTQAQDDPDSVDCFYASNKVEAACQFANPAQIAAKPAASSTNDLLEYSETLVEGVDCFFAENDAEAVCSASKAKSASAAPAAEHVVRYNNKHGS